MNDDYENYVLHGDPVPSRSELVAQWVRAVGADRQNEAWIASPYDTWEKNPYYVGPPVQHPEEYFEECLAFDECYCTTSNGIVGSIDAKMAAEEDEIPF